MSTFATEQTINLKSNIKFNKQLPETSEPPSKGVGIIIKNLLNHYGNT